MTKLLILFTLAGCAPPPTRTFALINDASGSMLQQDGTSVEAENVAMAFNHWADASHLPTGSRVMAHLVRTDGPSCVYLDTTMRKLTDDIRADRATFKNAARSGLFASSCADPGSSIFLALKSTTESLSDMEGSDVTVLLLTDGRAFSNIGGWGLSDDKAALPSPEQLSSKLQAAGQWSSLDGMNLAMCGLHAQAGLRQSERNQERRSLYRALFKRMGAKNVAVTHSCAAPKLLKLVGGGQ